MSKLKVSSENCTKTYTLEDLPLVVTTSVSKYMIVSDSYHNLMAVTLNNGTLLHTQYDDFDELFRLNPTMKVVESELIITN